MASEQNLVADLQEKQFWVFMEKNEIVQWWVGWWAIGCVIKKQIELNLAKV